MASSGASRPVSAARVRQVRYSSRVIHSRHWALRVSQPAMPTWSGCMWVQKMRVILLPCAVAASGPSSAISCRQAASTSGVLVPVSTMAQPGPCSSWSAMAQRLMWFSANGSGMRSHSTPGATSFTVPGAGGSPQG